MKRLFCLLLICFLTGELASPVNADAQARKRLGDSAKLSGNWWLKPVLPSDTVTGKLPNLSLDLLKRKFKGFTGCNEMSGSFRVRGDGIVFDKDIKVTKVACEGYNEKDFIANLLRVTRYELKNGILILLIDKTPISNWVRKTTTETVAIPGRAMPGIVKK
jgi:heat shock protein HslJ